MNYFNGLLSGYSWLWALIPNPIISTNEAWFLSNTEKVHALFKKIEEIIKTVNNQNEFITEFLKVVDELEEEIKKLTTEILNQWKEDGTIERMLSVVSEDYFNEFRQEITNFENRVNNKITDFENRVNKKITSYEDRPKEISKINMGRIWRTIIPTGSNSVLYDNDGHIYYSQLQGGCTFFMNGIKYYAYITIPQKAPYNTANYGELNIVEYNTGNIYRTLNPLYVGHGNSMCYLNGYLYVVQTTTYINGIAKENTNVLKIDVNTSEVVTKKMNGMTQLTGISSFNNELYLLSNTEDKIFKITDFETGTTELVFEIPVEITNEGLKYTNQDFAIDDKCYYILTVYPQVLIKINKDTRKYWIYNFEDVCDSIYATGELENITVYNNGIIDVGCCARMQQINYNTHNAIQLFSTNLITNRFVSNFKQQSHFDTFENIYVDSTDYEEYYNPNGTEAKPYRFLQEAINHALVSPSRSCIIHPKTSDRLFCTVNGNKPIIIYPDETKYSKDYRLNINGMYCRGANIKINLINFTCGSSVSSINAPLTNSFSVINFADCYFKNTFSSNYSKETQYGVYNNGGFITGRGEQEASIITNTSGGFVNYHN